ncbi:hypothetical protein Mapa_000391 [Marchantia paleacea]|nr:hypothetical protein Mapa_000391 [Marchantia paleacea]
MTTGMAGSLLAFLVLAAVARSVVAGEYNTFISNQSTRTIVATTTYRKHLSGRSGFSHRFIPPQTLRFCQSQDCQRELGP